MNSFLLLAAATFVSEDLTCIAAGALIASGKLGFLPGASACLLGIYFGDLLLYFAGRLVGRPIVRCRPFRRFLNEEKLERASAWLSVRGARVVILSRFTPGLRLPTYVAAGVLKTRFPTFAAYFFVAAAVWTPLLVGASALFGEAIFRSHVTRASLTLTAALWIALLVVRNPVGRGAGCQPAEPGVIPAFGPFRRTARRARRRLLGFFGRFRWEFWPPWLTYLPLVPYLLWLAVKHRSLTLFTAANPGIPTGGFAGESKSGILSRLPHVPAFELIPATCSPDERIRAARVFLDRHGLDYPVVLKPDVGQRGSGVAIIRTGGEMETYLRSAPADVIIQRYVAGPEFGVFYCRYPGEPRGRILSITEKLFPEITGDGRTPVIDLVLNDPRAVSLARIYLAGLRGPAEAVLAAGERIPLAELGSHCRGAIFLNGSTLETKPLRDAIDAAAKTHPGFYLGRFDLRAPSVAAFQAGNFSVIELNGVSAEPTHIYDPSVTVREAYRALFHQWRTAYEIGALNRRAGAQPTPLTTALRLALTSRAVV